MIYGVICGVPRVLAMGDDDEYAAIVERQVRKFPRHQQAAVRGVFAKARETSLKRGDAIQQHMRAMSSLRSGQPLPADGQDRKTRKQDNAKRLRGLKQKAARSGAVQSEDWPDYCHEAAHAIVAYHLGARNMQLQCLGLESWACTIDTSEMTPSHRGVVAYAGAAGEGMASGKQACGVSPADVRIGERALNEIVGVYGEPTRKRDITCTWKHDAACLVQTLWPAITATAKELHAKKIIGNREIARIYHERCGC